MQINWLYRDPQKWNVVIPFCYHACYHGAIRSCGANLPPLNALLAFEAAARHSNFTRAAQELSVAQPAVTRHVARLEDWIGSPLFRRNGSVVQLTREGALLSDLATTLLDRLELGIRDATRVGKDELVVGASFGIAHLWLMPKISALRMASEATVNFLTADDYRTFDDPSVDFSIRFGKGNFGVNCADLLFSEHCQIIAAPKFLDQHPEFDPDAPLATLDSHFLQHRSHRAQTSPSLHCCAMATLAQRQNFAKPAPCA